MVTPAECCARTAALRFRLSEKFPNLSVYALFFDENTRDTEYIEYLDIDSFSACIELAYEESLRPVVIVAVDAEFVILAQIFFEETPSLEDQAIFDAVLEPLAPKEELV